MLYFVGTPIGNLDEMTFRAVEILKSADVIYAEDTRRSAVLLNRYGIKRPVRSYERFNEKKRCDEIAELLRGGKTVAVISDAGMPLISDPGYLLVGRLLAEGLEYSVVGGPCALISALVLSGLDTRIFCMLGFLPQKDGERERLLCEYKDLPCTLVFYAPPHDLADYLAVMRRVLGARRVSVVREISKKFESVHRGILGEPFAAVEKGEIVIVVEGAKADKDAAARTDIAARLFELTAAGLSKMDAVKILAKELGVPKSEVYKLTVRTDESGEFGE
ncbi:MAG: 16S rRNA (cytidine(1402)-2'-O)-methyltransferase [Clostridiales bacterium]|jgi:16S rRNA (cytidine1402-2'-O)-methyltransferase|nr:16S rRNA (cytidine(1402)-2'-O)-methyltransferase [Clostridiales bacterium]